MINFNIEHGKFPIKRMLCLGAHCDDIEIGCGGTLLKLLKMFPDVQIYWVVFSSNEVREKEARGSAQAILRNIKNHTVIIKQFRNGYFPYVGSEIKDYFEELKTEIDPDIIFTHYGNDRHQDHRTISDLTWNTFRSHMILEYEILKYDGDLSAPNAFVDFGKGIADQKVSHILNYFKSQKDKQWFTADAFYSLMRLRGVECNSQDLYAEAFYCRKFILF